MPLTRERYKRVTDLYVVGKELVLRDGSVLWLQALNPLERDEAVHDAQVARSRMIMALQSDHASDERAKVAGAFWQDGRAAAIARLTQIKVGEQMLEIVGQIRDDPEWKERIELLDRGHGLITSAEPVEKALMDDISAQYLAEVERRQTIERDYLVSTYTKRPDEDLIDEYAEVWAERRGTEVANNEFAITELWYAARVCEGVQQSDGLWDHSACEQHKIRVFDSKEEVHSLPEELLDELTGVMQGLAMSQRDSKNSRRQGSSSDSSPLPSGEAASTPSTPAETPSERPGTSSPQSVTP